MSPCRPNPWSRKTFLLSWQSSFLLVDKSIINKGPAYLKNRLLSLPLSGHYRAMIWKAFVCSKWWNKKRGAGATPPTLWPKDWKNKFLLQHIWKRKTKQAHFYDKNRTTRLPAFQTPWLTRPDVYGVKAGWLRRKDNLHPFRWHQAAPTDFSDGKTKGTVIRTRLYPLHGLNSSTISFFLQITSFANRPLFGRRKALARA